MWDLEDGQRDVRVDLALRCAVGRVRPRGGAPRRRRRVTLVPHPGHGVWMEAVVSDDVETWYGYYHNEWPASRCGRDDRFVPRIGSATSTDRGRTWEDLGIVIQAQASSTACESRTDT